jgi:hypothetical protein
MIFIWRPLFARLDVVVNNAGYGDLRRSNSAKLRNPLVDGKVCARDVGSIVREQNAMAVATFRCHHPHAQAEYPGQVRP